MRKISAMYQWSGGTDYRHTCHECRNCVQKKQNKRTVHKCLSYGDTESPETDWKESFIACKAFSKKSPKIPLILQGAGEDQITGQMSIADFPEVMP